MTNQRCGLAVIFCGFISHLIGGETINIPEVFSGVHGFAGKTVKSFILLSKNFFFPVSTPVSTTVFNNEHN